MATEIALIERGVAVLGVEPDERMARVARRHGVPIEVASFEAWDPAARTFDLLTAGHAWHWVNRGAVLELPCWRRSATIGAWVGTGSPS